MKPLKTPETFFHCTDCVCYEESKYLCSLQPMHITISTDSHWCWMGWNITKTHVGIFLEGK